MLKTALWTVGIAGAVVLGCSFASPLVGFVAAIKWTSANVGLALAAKSIADGVVGGLVGHFSGSGFWKGAAFGALAVPLIGAGSLALSLRLGAAVLRPVACLLALGAGVLGIFGWFAK